MPAAGKRLHHQYLPCKLEYSVKNGCFRIDTVIPTELHTTKMPDINRILQQAYYKEPVTFLLVNERNALERAMLQFANYEKNTRRLEGNTYECQIYYNKLNETELLIEILSFGPMLKVTENESFLQLIQTRLKKQRELMSM